MLGFLVTIEGSGVDIEIDTRSKKEKNMTPVRQMTETGDIVMEYPSISSAERLTGIRNISECLSNKRSTAGGYLWELAD